MTVKIIPAIIPESTQDLEDKMSFVVRLAPLVQVDVLDGSLVPARSWPYLGAGQNPPRRPDRRRAHEENDSDFNDIINEKKGFPLWQDMEFEAHLMVARPEEVIEDWVMAGAARLIIQIEAFDNRARFEKCLELARGRVPLGLALALDTPNERIAPFAGSIEVIQCMGWNFKELGYQGRPFDERTLAKIGELRRLYPKIPVAVDGGVSIENAPALLKAGADRLVVGSAIWRSGNPREALAEFLRLV